MDIFANYFIGILFIAIGLVMKLYPPEHINNNLGYRTPFSMKSKDTWIEGNRFCGVMLLISGAIFMLFSMITRYLYKNTNLSTKISLFVLLIISLLNIVCTEIHLRMLFDKHGIRKWKFFKLFL